MALSVFVSRSTSSPVFGRGSRSASVEWLIASARRRMA